MLYPFLFILLSKRKARLINSTNFYYSQYYNLYIDNTSFICSKRKNITFFNKLSQNNFLNNNNSLKYSIVSKALTTISNKKTSLYHTCIQNIYLKKYFTSLVNQEFIYNGNAIKTNLLKKPTKGFLACTPLKIITSNKRKNIIKFRWLKPYKKTIWYFNTIYKKNIKQCFEKADQNKLINRKHNLRKLRPL